MAALFLLGGIMRFTTLNTWNDLMNYPNMKNWMKFLFLPESLGFFRERYADVPLRSAAYLEFASWGENLRGMADQLVDTANLVLDIESGERQCLLLSGWTDFRPDDNSEVRDNANTFLITTKRSPSDVKKRPAVIICPGGAYECVSFQNEGTPIQNFFENHGYAAFTLNYSVSPATYPLPQMDLLRACQFIKQTAYDFDVDPERIIFAGFSAGGHLAASSAALAEKLLPGTRPKAVVLGYPVITLEENYTHPQSAENLLNGSASNASMLSVEQLIGADYPPTYSFHNSDDDCVPCENTRMLEGALEAHGVDHLCEIFPTGNHGVGLGAGLSCCFWSENMLHFLKNL